MFGLEKLFGSDEAEEAAKVEEAAAREAQANYAKQAEAARGVYTGAETKSRADITGGVTAAQAYGEPYRAAGTTSLDALMASLGLQGQDKQAQIVSAFQSSPGYQFALEEGKKAREASAAAKGTLMSGGMLKELTAYGQGMANQDYGNWQQQLTNMAQFGGQMGENAAGREMQGASQLSDITQRTGTQVGQSYTDQGTQEANAALAAGQARASGIRGQAAAEQGALGAIGGLGGYIAGGPIGSAATQKASDWLFG